MKKYILYAVSAIFIISQKTWIPVLAHEENTTQTMSYSYKSRPLYNSYTNDLHQSHWKKLQQQIESSTISLENIDQYNCSPSFDYTKIKYYVTLQYIGNILYKWKHYNVLTAENGNMTCIKLEMPEDKFLSKQDAEILLTGSKLWIQEFQHSGITESIIGTDDRKKVEDTKIFPYNTIAKLHIKHKGQWIFNDGQCTGFLVGPHMLLTAGHCIYGPDGYTEKIEVVPALYESDILGINKEPYGRANAYTFGTNKTYIDLIDNDYNNPEKLMHDYGVIFIKAPFSGITTYMPLVFDYDPEYIYTAGYEGFNATMVASESTVSNLQDRVFSYTADTEGGQSGSPVWIHDESFDPSIRVVGIHISGARENDPNDANDARRLVSDNEIIIENWLTYVPNNFVKDGGYEEGTPNPYWNEDSSTYGTVICDISCNSDDTDAGLDNLPNNGAYFVWLGGVSNGIEEGSVNQTLLIPQGNMVLEFYYNLPICDSSADFLEITIDGEEVFKIDGASSLCGNNKYELGSIDISKFADGMEHTITFHSITYANNGGYTNFLVDDVSLSIEG